MRTLIALLATATFVAAAPAVVAKIPVSVAASPCAAAAGGHFVWVSEYGSPYVLRIDPKTNKVVGKTQIGFGSCGLGYGAGSMWIEDTSSSTISRVSVTTGKRLKAIPVGSTPWDATFAYGDAWTTAHGLGELERIDPSTNRIAGRWKLDRATGVVGAFGSVWAAGANGVIRVDPATRKLLATIPVAGGAGWTAASADAVWVTTPTGLARIDPKTNAVATTIPLPGAPNVGDPDVVDGLVWVPQISRNTIAVIDPATNTLVETVKAGTGPFVVTQIAGEAWVPSWKGADIWRFKP
jgi:DNA-binding beta-propeller fold protein YncE